MSIDPFKACHYSYYLLTLKNPGEESNDGPVSMLHDNEVSKIDGMLNLLDDVEVSQVGNSVVQSQGMFQELYSPMSPWMSTY